jgi:DNA-binding transcriptional ArsR family regulator
MAPVTSGPDALKGTTLRVYKYLFKIGRPASVRDVQRALGLSSPSVAEYHLDKLLRAGMIISNVDGYLVERRMLMNIIRIRRTAIPLQVFYIAFFLAALVFLVFFFGASIAGYLFGVAVAVAALAISIYETSKAIGSEM